MPGRLIFIAVLDAIIVVLGTIGAAIGFPFLGISSSLAFLSSALALIGLVTYFGILSQTGVNEAGLRAATASAVLTVYLVLVGEVAFFRSPNETPELTKSMLTHFTTVVGIVAAFFFGASAYVEKH
jgi:hypothetical protein